MRDEGKENAKILEYALNAGVTYAAHISGAKRACRIPVSEGELRAMQGVIEKVVSPLLLRITELEERLSAIETDTERMRGEL